MLGNFTLEFSDCVASTNGSLSNDAEDTVQQLGFLWEANITNPALTVLDVPSD